MYFDTELFEYVTGQSNIYAQQNNRHGFNLTVDELDVSLEFCYSVDITAFPENICTGHLTRIFM
jgi:hypothetical protein